MSGGHDRNWPGAAALGAAACRQLSRVKPLWLMSLRRRSQTARLSWEKFTARRPLLSANRDATPAARSSFDAKTRGRSPVAHAGI
jgi:hypothetical protein